MLKFYDREKEIGSLLEARRLSKTIGSQLTILIGRRRVGKSTLIKEAFKDLDENKRLYFFISKRRSHVLLDSLVERFNEHREEEGTFSDWDKFIKTLFAYASKNNVTLIFDEFQNFKYIDEDVFGLIQKNWEDYEMEKGLNIVVAGSIVSLMEKIFYSENMPLYGRATRKIILNELDIKTVYQLLKDNISKEVEIKDILNFYSVFGGIPFYYRNIERYGLFNENYFIDIIERLVIREDGILRTEGKDLIVREVGNENALTLFACIEAIATGFDTFTKITNFTGASESLVRNSLLTLEDSFKMIQKQKPIYPNNKKIAKYIIRDNFMYFWFKFIYANQHIIEEGYEENYLYVKEEVAKQIPRLTGYMFETLCKRFLLSKVIKKEINIKPSKVGNWWDAKGDIDIVIDDVVNKRTIYAECKLSSKKKELSDLLNKIIQTSNRVDALKNRAPLYVLIFADEVSKAQRDKVNQSNVLVFDKKDILKYLEKN